VSDLANCAVTAYDDNHRTIVIDPGISRQLAAVLEGPRHLDFDTVAVPDQVLLEAATRKFAAAGPGLWIHYVGDVTIVGSHFL
jgi:hypothetical protein